ncbi:MMPL family transporter [Nocardioides limicola]|uniref:MMPL family transporter n=1 Tax=Nocardioides limicola TaxID=2803368 RepID=UPI00193BC02A|nr:MMPL family transporter [Nocardioides sp. DJM-14]
MIETLGRFVVRRALPVLMVGLFVALGAAWYGTGVFGALSNGGYDDPASDSARQLELERDTFGNLGVDVVAIYSSEDLTADDPTFRGAVQQSLATLPAEHVSAVVPWYAVDEPAMVTEDGHAAQVIISLGGDDQDQMGHAYEEIAPLLEADSLTLHLAGIWSTYANLNDLSQEDLERAELIALPIVLLLSLIIFRSVVAALMPFMVGVLAMIGALAAVRLLTEVTEVSVFAVNVVTLLGMGLAIDYALFVVSRYREELTRRSVNDALVATMATAGRTIAFSGLIVAAAMSSLLLFPQAFLRSLGYGGIAAVLVAMVASLTVLPAVLALLGRRIDAGRLPWGRAPRDPHDFGFWGRTARAVMRRPIAVVTLLTAALIGLGLPFLGASWGDFDHRVLPAHAPAHQATEKLAEFGPEQATANVTLAGADQAGVNEYLTAVNGIDGLDAAVIAADTDLTVIRAIWQASAQSGESQEMVRALRAVEAPTGAEALVGGLSADTVDLLSSIAERLPWMGVFVVVVMLVLLFLAFGSIVLPIKAVLMNLLSISAAFGIVAWIFADGNLEGLLDFTSPGYLYATPPILMLAIVFGLSMDYEVFLLSRVREAWDATGDNVLAVATGVERTGRIITSAAVLLGVVIGAFALSGIVFMKILGVGMLIALLIDATVIRGLLVPATMKLLGRWNWWAPGPMRRWWLRHGFREESGAGQDPEPGSTPEPALVGR